MNLQRAKQTALAVVILGVAAGFIFGPWEGVCLVGLAVLIDSWVSPKRDIDP